jgi:hypothetical protein
MATVKYGALQLTPAPLVGISLRSNFFGENIRFSRTKVYALKGTILTDEQNNISGISLSHRDIVTGFAENYLPFTIDDVVVGYPKVTNLAFDQSNYLLREGYTVELEFLESGSPFQTTGAYYGFTGVTGLFFNIQSLSESLNYNTDFKSYNYSHSVNVTYRTGFNVDPLLNAKIIASGLLNNKSIYPFAISGGSFGNKVYEEKTDIVNGSYDVTENFIGSTGTGAYNHNYSVSINLNAEGITEVSQNGTIQGFNPNKYDNAKSGYAEIRNTIYQNCSGEYARYVVGTLNNTFLTDTRVDDILNGNIHYTRSFNDATGISDVKWVYSTSIELEGNKINAGEQGQIEGLGHISVRFSQASGFFTSIRPSIEQRVLEQYSGYGLTGVIYPISREQGFDRFHGSINYNYQFSNNNNFGLGSGIRSLETTITDQLPAHARVNFNVIHQGVLIQSLNSTKQGERNVNLTIQAFKETPVTGLLEFAKHTLNKYRPTGDEQLDPFLNGLRLNYNPVTNYLSSDAQYIYGGMKLDTDLNI